MILLALVPPAWRRVMDPRVADHFAGDLSRANMTPRRQARLARDEPAPVPGRESLAAGGEAHASLDASMVRGARCPGCGYTYDEQVGDAREGFPAGTPWAAVPDSWCCPDCGVREKVDFIAITRTSA